MNKFQLLSAAACAVLLQSASPALAYAVPAEQATCPIAVLGDEKAAELGVLLAQGEDDLSEAQLDLLTDAVNDCAAESGWTEADAKLALEFNVTLLAMIQLEAMLADVGVEAAAFETLLNDRSAEALKKAVDDPEKGGLIDAAIEMLVAQQGDKVTEEMSGNVGAYISLAAKAKLIGTELIVPAQ